MRLRHINVYGKRLIVAVCECADCTSARRILEIAKDAVRDAKRHLRSHHRAPQGKLTPEERAARALARWGARNPCPRCGKRPGGHANCGVRNPSPEGRAAHGRVVRHGWDLARRQRARAVAPAPGSSSERGQAS
jgi:hypothetical protein